MISIRMLKICEISICKLFELIFQSCIKHIKFPSSWKMANAVPVHKKSDKHILNHYRPVLLLPVCGKVVECLICNKSLLEYFIENDLISPDQSGYKQDDSWTNQLVSIIHEIYQSFDDGFEVRGVFL